jgi:glutathione S-transferase
MEYDDKIIGQSMSIARFIAKEHGLGGKDNVEAAMADQYVDCTTDLVYSK